LPASMQMYLSDCFNLCICLPSWVTVHGCHYLLMLDFLLEILFIPDCLLYIPCQPCLARFDFLTCQSPCKTPCVPVCIPLLSCIPGSAILPICFSNPSRLPTYLRVNIFLRRLAFLHENACLDSNYCLQSYAGLRRLDYLHTCKCLRKSSSPACFRMTTYPFMTERLIMPACEFLLLLKAYRVYMPGTHASLRILPVHSCNKFLSESLRKLQISCLTAYVCFSACA